MLRRFAGTKQSLLEYFKLMCDGSGEQIPHPLIHMGILGQGQLFRRSVVRVVGSMLLELVFRKASRTTEDGKNFAMEAGWTYDEEICICFLKIISMMKRH